MSKVLVDRELLERCVDRWACCAIVETPGAEQAWLELRAVVKAAQPAEAEGVELTGEYHADCNLLLAALSAVTAERDSLLQFKAAHLEWHEKTEWVQETAQVHELGKHRADVLKDRIDQLRAEVEMLREDAERWRYVSLQGDDTHWLNLLRVDLEDFGGNINAAVDALIDGDTPVTAAKEA